MNPCARPGAPEERRDPEGRGGGAAERHGHVGIQALGAVLPASADRVRRYASDIVTLAFCTFFCWKTWSLLIDAVKDGQISGSAWGAPLWIPYGCMAVGMTLLSLVLLLQVLTRKSLIREPFKTTAAH